MLFPPFLSIFFSVLYFPKFLKCTFHLQQEKYTPLYFSLKKYGWEAAPGPSVVVRGRHLHLPPRWCAGGARVQGRRGIGAGSPPAPGPVHVLICVYGAEGLLQTRPLPCDGGASAPEPGKATAHVTPRLAAAGPPTAPRACPSGARVRAGKAEGTPPTPGGPSPSSVRLQGHGGAAGAARPRASVVQVLLLPRGGGDGAVRVHDDLGAADDHDDEEQAEEDEAGQGQAFVHIHVDGLGRGLLHRRTAAAGSFSGSRPARTIFRPCREPRAAGRVVPACGGRGGGAGRRLLFICLWP